MASTLKAPPFLSAGQAVALICPSGYMAPASMAHAIEALTTAGFVVKQGLTTQSQHHYFSGTDEQRLSDLQWALDDPEIKAIFCARGGYGLSRILHRISFDAFLRQPKWVLGFSDVTVLLHQIEILGIQSVHGPMAAAFQQERGYTAGQFAHSSIQALMGQPKSLFASQHPLHVLGTVEAPITGGNLCMLAHLCGSSFHSSFAKGKILFLEEIGEYLYGIDRLLWQLERAGIFAAISGLVLGSFSDTKDTTIPFGTSLQALLHQHFGHRPYPVAYHMPVGHSTDHVAIFTGGLYRLHVSAVGARLSPVAPQ